MIATLVTAAPYGRQEPELEPPAQCAALGARTGGLGSMRESEVERHYRDSRILGIGGGTNEIMTEIVAKLLIA
jgi:alkylation response protein AidB-like acyl-CoA dehydrogenase